jgi:Subtilase family
MRHPEHYLFRRRFLKQAGAVAAIIGTNTWARAEDLCPCSTTGRAGQTTSPGTGAVIQVALLPVESCAPLTFPSPGTCALQTQNTVEAFDEAGSLVQRVVANATIVQLALKRGIYLLKVSGDIQAPRPRLVTALGGIVPISFYLGSKDWPWFRMGDIEVPFKPRHSWLAVTFPHRYDKAKVLTPDRMKELAKLGLEPFSPPGNPKGDWGADDQVLYLRTKNADVNIFLPEIGPKQCPDIISKVRALFKEFNPRAGMPIVTADGSARILDGQYIVRFRSGISDERIQALLDEEGAIRIAKLGSPINVWIIEFCDGANYLRHLGVVNEWWDSGVAHVSEPNLLFQLRTHAPAPNDRWFPCQNNPGNLARQRVPDAWQYIKDHVKAGLEHGSPDIVIATFDEGLNLAFPSAVNFGHGDVSRNYVLYCHDLLVDRDCCVDPNSSHGMSVYGIIGARIGNAHAQAGIAPRTSHISARYKSLTDPISFSGALYWLGGIPTVWDSALGVPVESPPVAADVINLSLGFRCLPLPTVLKECLQNLVRYGRQGRGTVVICSSGNDACDLQGIEAVATSECTISVGNTEVSSSSETKWSMSNYGFWLDLCANGQWAPGLTSHGEERNNNCPGDPENPPPTPGFSFRGAWYFGGTSAAAPMVSAVAGLMLTVYPDLRWWEIRDILCETAQKIDVTATGNGKWLAKDSSSPTGWSPATTSPIRGLDFFSKWYGYGRLDAFSAIKMTNELRKSRHAEHANRVGLPTLPAVSCPGG